MEKETKRQKKKQTKRWLFFVLFICFPCQLEWACQYFNSTEYRTIQCFSYFGDICSPHLVPHTRVPIFINTFTKILMNVIEFNKSNIDMRKWLHLLVFCFHRMEKCALNEAFDWFISFIIIIRNVLTCIGLRPSIVRNLECISFCSWFVRTDRMSK